MNEYDRNIVSLLSKLFRFVILIQVFENLEKLSQQPSAALTLQVFYDEQRPCSNSSVNTANETAGLQNGEIESFCAESLSNFTSFPGLPAAPPPPAAAGNGRTNVVPLAAAAAASLLPPGEAPPSPSSTRSSAPSASSTATDNTFSASSFTVAQSKHEATGNLIDFEPEPSLPNLSGLLSKRPGEKEDNIYRI